jgi:hypothetical protein
MRATTSVLALLLLSAFLEGCTLAATLLGDPSREEPIYVDTVEGKRVRAGMTFNQTADRRNVFFIPRPGAPGAPPTVLVCAEQPPDVAIAKAIRESIQVKEPKSGVTGTAGASMAARCGQPATQRATARKATRA